MYTLTLFENRSPVLGENYLKLESNCPQTGVRFCADDVRSTIICTRISPQATHHTPWDMVIVVEPISPKSKRAGQTQRR